MMDSGLQIGIFIICPHIGQFHQNDALLLLFGPISPPFSAVFVDFQDIYVKPLRTAFLMSKVCVPPKLG